MEVHGGAWRCIELHGAASSCIDSMPWRYAPPCGGAWRCIELHRAAPPPPPPPPPPPRSGVLWLRRGLSSPTEERPRRGSLLYYSSSEALAAFLVGKQRNEGKGRLVSLAGGGRLAPAAHARARAHWTSSGRPPPEGTSTRPGGGAKPAARCVTQRAAWPRARPSSPGVDSRDTKRRRGAVQAGREAGRGPWLEAHGLRRGGASSAASSEGRADRKCTESRMKKVEVICDNDFDIRWSKKPAATPADVKRPRSRKTCLI